MRKRFCSWWDETSAMKRAYDNGLIDKQWIENYCWNAGENCVRKKIFEEDGVVLPDYVLPDGKEDPKLKKLYEPYG